MVVPSVHSAKGVADAQQEHWASTEALLTLFASWATQRRRVVDRLLSNRMGQLFLEATCKRLDFAPLVGWRVPDSVADACEVEPRTDGVCACLAEAMSKGLPGEVAQVPHEFVWAKLVFLVQRVGCKACLRWARLIVDHLAMAIERNVQDWGDFQWHRSMLNGGPPVKRRRVDYHIRQEVVAHAVVEGRQPTAAIAARGMVGDRAQGLRWVQAEMAAYRSSGLMSFQKLPVWSLSVDAARIGKPAREFLVGALSAADLHGILPPQVIRGQPKVYPRRVLTQSWRNSLPPDSGHASAALACGPDVLAPRQGQRTPLELGLDQGRKPGDPTMNRSGASHLPMRTPGAPRRPIR